MKKKSTAVLLILGLLVLCTCGNRNEIESRYNTKSKKVYIKQLKSQIYKWDIELKKLDANTKKLKNDAKIYADQRLALIHIQRDYMERKLKEIQDSKDKGWTDLKREAESGKFRINMVLLKAKADLK